MKKLLLKSIAFVLCFSTLMFAGCSNCSGKGLDLSFYLASSTSGKFIVAGKSEKTINTSALFSDNLSYELVDEYYSISFNSNKSYMYKMYVDYIEVTVYTNQTLDSQMDITLSITNLADKDNLRDHDTPFKTDISLYPKENSSKTFKIDVKKVVATATPSTFTFDLSTSSEVISAKNDEPNEFKWFIYGLKIYGENVVYN